MDPVWPIRTDRPVPFMSMSIDATLSRGPSSVRIPLRLVTVEALLTDPAPGRSVDHVKSSLFVQA